MVRDQMGFEVAIRSSRRIISLVPSQTELLFDLGLADRVVGVTKFCVHPERTKSKTIIGGTKNFHLDVIAQLQPDLIIGNKEENYEEGIGQLRSLYPVWMSDIFTRKDAVEMIVAISEITNTLPVGKAIIYAIDKEFEKLKSFLPLSILYLIWKKPWMAAGGNTFIDAMLKEVGLTNVVKEVRYPELSNEQVKLLSPQLIFLSSEPYPFNENHIAELEQLVPSAKICLVNGEMFSWYGSRLTKAPAYFNTLRDQLS